MGIAVGVLLYEYSSCGKERGISHKEEGFRYIRDGKDRGGREKLTESIKHPLLQGTPSPGLVFSGEGSEGSNNVGVVGDEFPVEVGETEEGANSLNRGGWFPSGDGSQFGGVHAYKSLSDDHTKIFHGRGVKRTFRDLEGQSMFPKTL